MTSAGGPEVSSGSWRSGILRADRAVWATVDGILLVCVGSITAAVTLQVVSRLLGHSLPWTEELARILFIWTAFLGMAVGFRRVEHPRIMLLPNSAPAAIQVIFSQLYAVVGIVFFCTIGWFGWLLVRQQFVFGETSPVLGIGMYLASVPIVMASILAIIAHLVTVYVDQQAQRLIRAGGTELS